MKSTADKLREARIRLGFSQGYVAKCMGMGRSAVTQIELGNRKINSDEIAQFCRLYHLSADYLLDSGYRETKQMVFVRRFQELNDNDQQEILNFMAFKKAMYDR